MTFILNRTIGGAYVWLSDKILFSKKQQNILTFKNFLQKY